MRWASRGDVSRVDCPCAHRPKTRWQPGSLRRSATSLRVNSALIRGQSASNASLENGYARLARSLVSASRSPASARFSSVRLFAASSASLWFSPGRRPVPQQASSRRSTSLRDRSPSSSAHAGVFERIRPRPSASPPARRGGGSPSVCRRQPTCCSPIAVVGAVDPLLRPSASRVDGLRSGGVRYGTARPST
jgi:hypothetical protein